MEMKSIDDSHWQQERKDVASRRCCEFKVFINDEIWPTGHNDIAIDENNVPSFLHQAESICTISKNILKSAMLQGAKKARNSQKFAENC
jgi:hypothetical protein